MSGLLKLLLSAMRLATWKEAIGAALTRLAVFCLLMTISGVLALAGLGFGLYAAFVSLSSVMSPAIAAATIGAATAVIAALLTVLALRRSRRGVGRRRSGADAAVAGTEAIDQLTRLLGEWVRANPGQATTIALAAGFLLGSRR
jgi:hypothetical protein